MTVSPLSTARAMTFRSSRTLPGHAQPLASASASSERRGHDREPVAAREQPQKVGRKRLDVLEALAKRRDRDRKDVEAIKEVFAKASLLHHASQVPVRRADDAHVDRHLLVAAHAPEGLALQHAKELRLDAGRQIAHFVQKKRPLVGLLEKPDVALARAREGAALEAEELALDQTLGKGRAVDAHEGRIAPGGHLPDRRRHHLLPDARLAREHHGRIVGRNAPDLIRNARERRRMAQQLPKRRLAPLLDRLLKAPVFRIALRLRRPEVGGKPAAVFTAIGL